MAFLLYGSNDGAEWIRRRQYKLGTLLADWVKKDVLPPSKEPPHRWHVEEAQLLALEVKAEDESTGHALVVDVTPKRKRELTLLRITDVWGFTDQEWTPILVGLREFACWKTTGDPENEKARVESPGGGAAGERVYEFLFLRHLRGPSKGWNWGRAGLVNAALLYPDPLQWFLECLGARSQGGASAT